MSDEETHSSSANVNTHTDEQAKTRTNPDDRETVKWYLRKKVDPDDTESIVNFFSKLLPSAAETLETALGQRDRYRTKLNRLKNKYDKSQQQVRELQNKTQKQKSKQKSNTLTTREKNIISELIDIRNDIQRLEAANQPIDNNTIEVLLQKADQSFTRNSITPIAPSKGNQISPEEHHVMSQVESDTIPKGHIVECHEPGYQWRGVVVEPAKVVTAK